MGSGSWTALDYAAYSTSMGRSLTSSGESSTQNMFTQKVIHANLNPYKVIRECCDSEEHPNTVPVILALDVTGSMGSACKRTASALNVIMSQLYKNHTDIEFLIMGIGDLAYDDAPIQASQFESDIRIAEQTDEIYFEGGGGGNAYESYTAAWFFGLHHTKLDCWKRGKKGIIITLGDEPLNPYLPRIPLVKSLGDSLQADVETKSLYEEAIKKFDIYHIAIDDKDSAYYQYADRIKESFGFLGQNLVISNIDTLPQKIADCIDNSIESQSAIQVIDESVSSGPISW